MKINLVDGMKNGARVRDKLELMRGYKVADIEGHVYIDIRLYMSRSGDGASPVHCLAWVNGYGNYGSGYGKASGYGYDKFGPACQAALNSAGISEFNPIYGTESIPAVLKDLADQLTTKKTVVIEFYP